MIKSDATKETEGLKDFFKSVGRATISKIGSAAASRNPRAALAATPDLIKFPTTGKSVKVVQKGRGLYLGTKKR